jgi:hypothetical protein
MAMSEEREVAVRKEMPVMYKEGVTCEGMAYEAGVPETSMEGARVPSTAAAAVPSTAAEAPTVTTAAPAPCIAMAVGPTHSAATAVSVISVLRNISFLLVRLHNNCTPLGRKVPDRSHESALQAHYK